MCGEVRTLETSRMGSVAFAYLFNEGRIDSVSISWISAILASISWQVS